MGSSTQPERRLWRGSVRVTWIFLITEQEGEKRSSWTNGSQGCLICDRQWRKATWPTELHHHQKVKLVLEEETQVEVVEKRERCLPLKALLEVCAGEAPNDEPPKGDAAAAAAGWATKAPKPDGLPEADVAEPPKPPKENPLVDAAAASWVPKPEKLLPNVWPPLAVLPNRGVPVEGVAIEVAGTADLKLNAPAELPKALVLGAAGVAAAPALPNPAKTLAEGAEDAVLNTPPKGLVLGVEAPRLGLAPNPDEALVTVPKPPPKILVVGAEVVAAAPPPNSPIGAGVLATGGAPNSPVGAGVLATDAPPNIPMGAALVVAVVLPKTPGEAVVEMPIPPNAPPNGLVFEATGLVKGPVLAADDVATTGLLTKPLPKAEVVAGANGLAFEVDSVVDCCWLNTPPNDVGAELVIAGLLPNPTVLDGLIDEKGPVVVPMKGFEPKPLWSVETRGLVVGEVEWTDVVMVEACDPGAPKPDEVDETVGMTGTAALAVAAEDDGNETGAVVTTTAEELVGVIPNIAGFTSEGGTLGTAGDGIRINQ